MINPPTRFLLMGLLLFAAAHGSLRAQGGKVIIECISFPKSGALSKLEVLIGEKKTEILEIPSHTLSQPVEIPRLAVWKFGKSGEDAEGNFKFTTYGQVRPAASRSQILVFVRKGKENQDGFGVVALDGTNKGFGDQKFMIMNLARQEVAGVVGTRKFRLPPGKHTILEPKADKGEDLCHANLMYQRKEKWRTFFSTNWPLLKESRGLVFVYQDPKRGTMQMHTVVDSLKKIPKPKPDEG